MSKKPGNVAELWAFGSPRGRWLGNTYDGYIGCWSDRTAAEAIRPELEEPNATGPHLIGVDPRWRDVARRLYEACRKAVGMLDIAEWEGVPSYESIRAALAFADTWDAGPSTGDTPNTPDTSTSDSADQGPTGEGETGDGRRGWD